MRPFTLAAATSLMLLLGTATVQAQTVRLSWDPSPDPSVAGYVIEYGPNSREYTQTVDAGNVTDYAVQGLPAGRPLYFAVRAYSANGQSSPLSNELSATVKQLTTGLLPGRTELFWRHATTGAVAMWKLDRTNQLSVNVLDVIQSDANWRIAGAGDFNADNETDLVLQHRDGDVRLWLLRGGTLLSDQTLTSSRFDRTSEISAIADIDGDGTSDLVWRHRTSRATGVTYLDNTSVRGEQVFRFTETKDENWTIAGAADFDADGYADLLWRDATTGALLVSFLKGVKPQGGRSVALEASETSWRVASLGDVNVDGRADIIWQHADGRLAAWILNNGTLVETTSLNPGLVEDVAWRIAAGR